MLGGRAVSEYNSAGARRTTYAWAGGGVLARQEAADTATPRLRWESLNPVTGDGRETDAEGKVITATHLDPAGVDVGEGDPFGGGAGDPSAGAGNASIQSRVAQLMTGYFDLRCRIDGQLVGCAVAEGLAAAGAAEACPDNVCGPTTATVVTTYASGRKETRLVAIPQGSLPGGFGERFTGAAARAAAEQFEMAVAGGEGGGAAVYWALFAGRMLSGQPVDGAASYFAPQNSGLTILRDHNAYGRSFGPGDEELIRKVVQSLFSDKCTQAFKDAGLKSPKELMEKGVVTRIVKLGEGLP